MIQPIGPINGVSPDLIRALNERFRQITTSTGAKATAGGRQTRIKEFRASDQAPGDFFVEMDRGNALYQIQAGQWLLVSGSLVGLDANKPTDLGVSDTGFLYRSTDTLQDFRWDGGAWVETTISAIIPTAQSVVTGSRAIGTVYQNAGTTPIFCAVTLRCVAGGGANFGQVNLLTDAANPPTTVISSTFNGSAVAGVSEHLSFWVLPGNYYKVAAVTSSVTLERWVEWS